MQTYLMHSVETTARWLKYKIGLTDRSPLTTAVRPCYDLFLKTLYQRKGLKRTILGEETVQIRPAYRNFPDDFEGRVFSYLKRSIRQGDCVLDVGAHMGMFTILLARWVGTTGRVYAFEPNPQLREALLDHMALNDVANRVVVSPLAISNAVGRALFSSNGLAGTNRIVDHGGGDTYEVAVTTIDTFCSESGAVPSLIKIDIEGFEFHALVGAMQTLEKHRPVVVVEMHPFFWGEVGTNNSELGRILKESGYHAIALDGQADLLRDYGHIALEPD